MFGAKLYEQEAAEGAEGAIEASLGCGVPTAIADLRPGETVLDLGSGAVTSLDWKAIGRHVGDAPTTAIYLYARADDGDSPRSPCRAVIATLGLTSLRVGELCQLNNGDIHLAQRRLHIADAKTEAGIRGVDIHPRLLAELTTHQGAGDGVAGLPHTRGHAALAQQHPHARRLADAGASERITRAARGAGRPRTCDTHTFRRSYISFMVAAGYDIPYIQAQVGHRDPTTTLAIYPQVLARPDRDELRAEIRQLLGVDPPPEGPNETAPPRLVINAGALKVRAEKAGKGRSFGR